MPQASIARLYILPDFLQQMDVVASFAIITAEMKKDEVEDDVGTDQGRRTRVLRYLIKL